MLPITPHNRYPAEVHLVHRNKRFDDIATAAADPQGLAVLSFLIDTTALTMSSHVDGFKVKFSIARTLLSLSQ